MPGFVTTSISEFPNGLLANFTLDQVAILELNPAPWRRFAISLDSELTGFQTNPMNYTLRERDFFQDLRTGLAGLTKAGQAKELLGDTLLHQAEHGPPPVRLSAGMIYFLCRARAYNLVLLPLGLLKAGVAPWTRGRGIFRVNSSDEVSILSANIKRLARASQRNTDDIRIFDRNLAIFLSATKFSDPEMFTDSFFETFWRFFYDKIQPLYSSQKANSTIFSRHLGLFNLLFQSNDALRSYNSKLSITINYNSAYWHVRFKQEVSVSNPSFDWLIGTKPHLAEWAKHLSDYVENNRLKNPTYQVTRLRRWCKYLITMKNPPLSPNHVKRWHVSRKSETQETSFCEFLEQSGDAETVMGYLTLLAMKQFFEVWHDRCGTPDDGWSNPVLDLDMDGRWRRGSLDAKTNKEILPVRIIKMMKSIIIDDDFRWPKTVKSDYFRYNSKDTAEFEQVWSPARALALYTLLILPLRSIQVRMLDSGEGDEYQDGGDEAGWLPNDGQLAEKGRQEGVLQRIPDLRTKRDYLGLHITTNKSAVVTEAEFEKPYDIPWECRELIPHLRFLRQWQSDYNPVAAKLTRRDLTDSKLWPSKILQNLPGYYFLFRDAASNIANRNEPVSYARLRSFMYRLLEEVERRLVSEGENILLVSIDKYGARESPFSLHGLRAAGITHFVEGGVPIQVIAEFLSAHSTLMMTIHYMKHGPGYVTDIIDRALENMRDGSQDDFLEELVGIGPEALALKVAAVGPEALDRLSNSTPGTWTVQIDGICPVGCALCHIGGERLSTHNNPYYASVPGGPSNCPQCRFFLTGPPFLNGQVIAFNNVIFSLSEKAKSLNQVKKEVVEAEAKGLKGRRLERLRGRIDALELEIDGLLRSVQARYLLIENTRKLMAKRPDERESLVSVGDQEDMDLVLESTSEFDLLEFVAQACEVFPEKAQPSAPLRKGKILDQFMRRNGYEALFYALPDDEALAAGNRLTRFLSMKVGRERVRSLMHGEDTLASLGIKGDFELETGKLLLEQRTIPGLDGGRQPWSSRPARLSKPASKDRALPGPATEKS